MINVKFSAWPDIVAFHVVRKNVVDCPSMINEKAEVTYIAKAKQHGCNGCIHITEENVIAQSRAKLISPQNDNAGFATFVEKNKDLWMKMAKPVIEYIVCGEWCGKNINQGCAIHDIPNRIFAVFAIVCNHYQPNSDELNIDEPYKQEFIVDPDQINKLLPNIPDVYIIPWYGDPITINWLEAFEKLEPIAEKINESVLIVEKCDPWVKGVFGIEGTGEGLVYYPVSHPGKENFANLGFKAKGEKHKMVAAKSAQVNPEKVSDCTEFVNLVLTEARLEQGVRAVSDGQLIFDVKNTGKFLEWICKDILKECQTEMDVSALEWKFVNKPLSLKARNWFMSKMGK